MNNEITTKVDRLISYLKQEDWAKIKELSRELDAPEKKVNRWVKVLSDSELVDKNYSFSGITFKASPNLGEK